MKLQVALAGACVLALAAGTASAAVNHHAATMRHHHVRARASASGRFAGPSQPIAYSKLDAYMKASPRARASQSWGLDNTGMAAGATTGAAANASATAPTAPNETGASAPAPSTAAPNPPPPSQEPAAAPAAPPATPDTSVAPPASSGPAPQ